MKIFKVGGVILFTFIIGILGGLFMYERIFLDAKRDLEKGIIEYQKIEADVKAFNNFSDNVTAFHYVKLLEQIESNEFEDAKTFLISYLTRRYRLALKWSKSEDQDELYRKFNKQLIKKIDVLSDKSELFNEIRRNGNKDS